MEEDPEESTSLKPVLHKPERPERNARELSEICNSLGRGLDENGHSIENSALLSRLRTLCNMVPGTISLREYVVELFEVLLKKNSLQLLPGSLCINVQKGSFGLFNPVFGKEFFGKEFERKKILIDQPIAKKNALRSGNADRAQHIQERIDLWRARFGKMYGEPPETGADMEEVAHIIESSRQSSRRKRSRELSSP